MSFATEAVACLLALLHWSLYTHCVTQQQSSFYVFFSNPNAWRENHTSALMNQLALRALMCAPNSTQTSLGKTNPTSCVPPLPPQNIPEGTIYLTVSVCYGFPPLSFAKLQWLCGTEPECDTNLTNHTQINTSLEK